MGTGECSLLPGFFGILVQFALFVLVCLVLVMKKKLEDRRRSSRRPWPVFCLDCSKQVIGAGWLHLLNLLSATMLGRDKVMGACEWYWLNIVIDDTLGVYVEYLLFCYITRALRRALSGEAENFRSGSYRHSFSGEFQLERYAKQLVMWLLVVSLMKVAMLLIMVICKTPLQRFTSFALWPVLASPTAELIVVMIITPFFMNALQCWVVDNFIRYRGDEQEAAREAAQDERPLDNAPAPSRPEASA
mmetsp:Transcript_69267/g.202809  ORF Transcript_69267/g.202809 Transcript_69267/m.202809 type:complete len:246 (-) Transcript_69267:131-868(-)